MLVKPRSFPSPEGELVRDVTTHVVLHFANGVDERYDVTDEVGVFPAQEEEGD